MALTSVYYDGTVTETQRAQNLAGAAEYGVYGADDFKVTAHPSIANAVLVKAGKAHGHGVTDVAAEDQVVNCTPLSSGQARWDLIVIRRNWQPNLGGPSTLQAIHAGGLPTIPNTRKNTPGVEDDQPIFLVKWQGGISAPVEFRDLRVWSGNNGLYAVEDEVRNYLNRPGTQINIKGVQWTSIVGANGVVMWEKSSEGGKVPLFGTGPTRSGGTPPPGTQFLVQSGSSVIQREVNGYGSILFPRPFPNGVVSARVANGDISASGRGFFAAVNFTTNDALHVNLSNGNGVGFGSNVWRCDWEVTGW